MSSFSAHFLSIVSQQQKTSDDTAETQRSEQDQEMGLVVMRLPLSEGTDSSRSKMRTEMVDW